MEKQACLREVNGSERQTDAGATLFGWCFFAQFNHFEVFESLAVHDKAHERTALVPSLQACGAGIDVQTT